MKEKAKKFWTDNKKDAMRILYLGLGMGAGYLIGAKVTELKIELGLTRCIRMKPELEAILKESVDLASKEYLK